MALYSVGYAAVIWVASASGGALIASRRLLHHAALITRVSAFALSLVGAATVFYGLTLLRR